MLCCLKSTLRSLDEELCVWLWWTHSCWSQWLKKEHQLYPLFSLSGSSATRNQWSITKANGLCRMTLAGGLQLAGHELQGVFIWRFLSHNVLGQLLHLHSLAHIRLLAGRRWYKHKTFLSFSSIATRYPSSSEILEETQKFFLKNGPKKPPQRFAMVIFFPPWCLVNLTQSLSKWAQKQYWVGGVQRGWLAGGLHARISEEAVPRDLNFFSRRT